MTDTDRTDDLGSLFVSVTGSDSVVEPQEADSSSRELRTDATDETVDAASFHGLDDAIDDPESVEASP
ncbi:hypothetical protein [Halopiger goleimassiliensis]|uniref:hypothetical protein n=1 Tax=Halopiger goleimassiliensis TaxID=1293048 RepID=UPI000677C9FE|nr:hypothetical protein [Halopiger goleimassiliensis]